MIIGFNTGGLRDYLPRVSKESIDFIRSTGSNAIEFSVKDMESIDALNNISREDLKGFKYISLHSPTRMMVPDMAENTLAALQRQHNRLRFDTIVVHPVDIGDFAIFKKFDLPIAFENMDWRKSKYRTVEDMKTLFKDHDYPMVFDIQHAYSNDPTGNLADDFSEQFVKRIVEVHISGIDEKNDHCLLFENKQSNIITKIPRKIPIIIESDAPKTSDLKELADFMRKELEYIEENLR